ncbi:MAG: gamma-glutamyltransferase [Rhodothermales bacterium]
MAGQNGMVAAAHPLAADAGAAVLKQGGNAIDAAVASAFVVGVVEPMMSGIGGGGSMTVWLEEQNQAEYLNFYARAGSDPDYERDGLRNADVSKERWVAIPGAVDGLLKAHERFGRLPLAVVMEPAIRIAEEGFHVHPMLARIIADYKSVLTHDSTSAALFYPDDAPLQAGDLLVQQTLAETLKRILIHGRDGYYAGPVAQEIIRKLSKGDNPITLDELAGYDSQWLRPQCSTYNGYTVLTAPPPLGGTEVLLALELLEPYDLPAMGTPDSSSRALATYIDAFRIAQTDRIAYMGDPDAAAVPAVGLTSEAYAKERSIYMGNPAPARLPEGNPWDEEQMALPKACQLIDPFGSTTLEYPPADLEVTKEEESGGHTTHLSVIDKHGNAVSLTYTMGLYFGSGVYAGGAFLNSAANLFNSRPANRRGPHRTPRSTTAPTIVLEGDNVRLAVGAAGAGRIGPAIVEMITYILDYGIPPEQAISMPRMYPFSDTVEVRIEDGFTGNALTTLRNMNYNLNIYPKQDIYFGGVHLVYLTKDGTLVGAADPRRNGKASGY